LKTFVITLLFAVVALPVVAQTTYRPANPNAAGAPGIYAADGTYLGRLSSNPYDPQSTSNPYGTYGSPYSPTSINNPYSVYGSPYSTMSPNNPYATSPPATWAPIPAIPSIPSIPAIPAIPSPW
jgi:hypothetical protein